jgi:hypothetical protein
MASSDPRGRVYAAGPSISDEITATIDELLLAYLKHFVQNVRPSRPANRPKARGASMRPFWRFGGVWAVGRSCRGQRGVFGAWLRTIIALANVAP